MELQCNAYSWRQSVIRYNCNSLYDLSKIFVTTSTLPSEVFHPIPYNNDELKLPQISMHFSEQNFQ